MTHLLPPALTLPPALPTLPRALATALCEAGARVREHLQPPTTPSPFPLTVEVERDCGHTTDATDLRGECEVCGDRWPTFGELRVQLHRPLATQPGPKGYVLDARPWIEGVDVRALPVMRHKEDQGELCAIASDLVANFDRPEGEESAIHGLVLAALEELDNAVDQLVMVDDVEQGDVLTGDSIAEAVQALAVHACRVLLFAEAIGQLATDLSEDGGQL